MQRRVPPIPNRADICIHGDVTVEAGVAIGPGVVLQAAPGSALVVRSGVCLGAGAIVQAQGGQLEIQADAILGARVLIVGAGTVGAAASIGCETTVIAPDVAPGQSIARGALLGNPSALVPNQHSSQADASPPEPEDIWADPVAPVAEEPMARALDPIGCHGEPTAAQSRAESTNGSSPAKERHNPPPAEQVEPTVTVRREEVIVGGRKYVQQLLSTIFPYKDR